MSEIKVAFCVPNMIIGGLETVFISTLDALAADKGIKISVFMHAPLHEPLYIQWFKEHPEIPVRVYYPLCHRFENLRPYCRTFPLKQIRKIIFSIYKKYRRLVMRFCRAMHDQDVFIDYKNMEFYKELHGRPQRKIAWCHGSIDYFETHRMPARMPIYDRLVTITDEFADEFRRRHPELANKIIRIYNPVDVNAIRRRAECGETMDGPYFCHVSRLADGKDVKTLLNAFDLFIRNTGRDDVKLLIVGGGNKADGFRRHAEGLACKNNVIFTGTRANPYGFMKGALCNILSSESEGMGMVLVESQALGVVAVSSECKNGPREVLENGDAGFLFPVGDADTLARIMEYVTSHPDEIHEKVHTATKGLARFDPRTISQQILDIIKE